MTDRMTNAEIISMVRLHEKRLRGRSITLRFNEHGKAMVATADGRLVEVKTTLAPCDQVTDPKMWDVVFPSVDDVAWERVDMLIQRLEEIEAGSEPPQSDEPVHHIAFGDHLNQSVCGQSDAGRDDVIEPIEAYRGTSHFARKWCPECCDIVDGRKS